MLYFFSELKYNTAIKTNCPSGRKKEITIMKKTIALLTVLVMMMALVFTAFAADQTDSDYVKEKGTLVVGITDFAPMD